MFLSLTNFIISDMFNVINDLGYVFSVMSLHYTKLFITTIDN